MKKKLSLLLALVLLFLPVKAVAAELEWTLSEDGKTLTDSQQEYTLYRLPDQDLFYPAVLFEYAQELEDPEDEAYYAWIETNDAFRYFMVLSGYCSDGDIYDVYTTETGAQILDRFAAGQYAFILLGDEFACEAAAVSLDWVSGLDAAEGAADTLDVTALADVERYTLWGGDASGTFYHPHGGLYKVDGSWYYINYDNLDNSYFDAYGNFSYRKGTVEAKRLTAEQAATAAQAAGEREYWEQDDR